MANEDIQRLNYYEKQYLRTRDFQDEQAYHIEMRRRHLIAHHLWGVVAGLQVTQDAVSKVWAVQPGLAVDGFGREVLVPAAEPLNLNLIRSQLAREITPAMLNIWLAYRVEKTNRPAPGYEVCGLPDQFIRIRETFRLIYQDEPPTRDQAQPPKPHENLPDDPAEGAWPVYLGTLVWDVDPGNPAVKIITRVDEADARGTARRHYLGAVASEIYSPNDNLKVQVSRAEFRNDAVINGTVGDGAGVLRLDVDSSAESVLTNKKVATEADPSTDAGNLYIRTNNEAGGNQVVIDRDTLEAGTGHVTGNLIVDGSVGIGADTPNRPLSVRGVRNSQELASFEDDAGTTKWHFNQNLGGNNPGFNLAETGVAHGRIFFQPGGNTGIGTTNPQASLHVAGGDIRWGNGSQLTRDQGGSIELGANGTTAGTGTPYIDFHFQGQVQDFNTGIINDSNGRLNLVATTVRASGSLNVTGNANVVGAIEAANLFAGLPFIIRAGSTVSGATAWQEYGTTGVFVDVNTAAAGFTSTPLYITALHGSNQHWATTGGSSVYNPTPTGFRIYLRFSDGSNLTPAEANTNFWHIQWIGVQL